MNTVVSDCQAAAVPILFSSNLRESSVFYSDGLGFAVYKDADGLRVRRAELDLKIAYIDDKELVSNLSVVFRVKQIRKLHGEYTGRSLPHLGPLKQKSCGKLQFSLSDPHSNSLYFVEDIA